MVPKVEDGEGGRVGGTGEYMGRGVGRRVTGRILKKGREERNSAARLGRGQRLRTERGVGWEGQENTWDVVWSRVTRRILKKGREERNLLPG